MDAVTRSTSIVSCQKPNVRSTTEGSEMEILTSKKQRDMMRHAVGMSNNGTPGHRNYYCASIGCDGFDDLLALVGMGLMTKQKGSISEDFVFYVTDKGKQEIH